MNESGFSGPYIAAAFLCEKVLIEAGNIPTFVRVVDRFMVPKFAQPLPPGVQIPQQTIQVNLVVILKAGDLGAGSHTLKIRIQKPDQSYAAENNVPLFFQGSDDNGAMLNMPVMMPNPEEGLHWFDVLFEDSLLTRVPMRILHQPAILQGQIPSPSGGQ